MLPNSPGVPQPTLDPQPLAVIRRRQPLATHAPAGPADSRLKPRVGLSHGCEARGVGYPPLVPRGVHPRGATSGVKPAYSPASHSLYVLVEVRGHDETLLIRERIQPALRARYLPASVRPRPPLDCVGPETPGHYKCVVVVKRALLARARAVEGECEADLVFRQIRIPLMARGVHRRQPRRRYRPRTLTRAGTLAGARRCPLRGGEPRRGTSLPEGHPITPRSRSRLVGERLDGVVGAVGS